MKNTMSRNNPDLSNMLTYDSRFLKAAKASSCDAILTNAKPLFLVLLYIDSLNKRKNKNKNKIIQNINIFHNSDIHSTDYQENQDITGAVMFKANKTS